MAQWIITSSVLILIVIALRALLKGHISLRLQYGLWALVLLRLLIPVSIPSQVSVMNALPQSQAQADLMQKPLGYVGYELPDIEKPQMPLQQPTVDAVTPSVGVTPQEPVTPPVQNTPQATVTPPVQNTPQEPVTPPVQNTPPADEIEQYEQALEQYEQEIEKAKAETGIAITAEAVLMGIWVAGMLITAGCLLVCNGHFARKLRRSRVKSDTAAPLPVYITPYVATPCLFGLFRPAIYLTPDVTEGTVKNHVLAHELTHYRHRDHIWSVLRCICLILHWYNPLVWAVASLSRKDAELACDEATIQALGEEQRKDYGRTLIGMTQVKKDSKALLITATTMVNGKKTLKERIVMIAKHPRTAIITLIVVILIATVAVICTFTGVKGSESQGVDSTDTGLQNTNPSENPSTDTIPPESNGIDANSYLLYVNGKLYSGNTLYNETTTAELPTGYTAIGTITKQLSGTAPAEAFQANLLEEGKNVYANPNDDRYVFCDFSESGISKYILLVQVDHVPEAQPMSLSFLNKLVWTRQYADTAITVADFLPYGLIKMDSGSYRFSYTFENYALTLYVTYDKTGCSSVLLSRVPDQITSGTMLDLLTCYYDAFTWFVPAPKEEDYITVEQIKQIVAEKGANISHADFASFVPSYAGGSGIYTVSYPIKGGYFLNLYGSPNQIGFTNLYFRGDEKNGIDIRTDDIDAYIEKVNSYADPLSYKVNPNGGFVCLDGKLYGTLTNLNIFSYAFDSSWRKIGPVTDYTEEIPVEHLQAKGLPTNIEIYQSIRDHRFVLVSETYRNFPSYQVLIQTDYIAELSILTLNDLELLIRNKGDALTAEDFIPYGLTEDLYSKVTYHWHIEESPVQYEVRIGSGLSCPLTINKEFYNGIHEEISVLHCNQAQILNFIENTTPSPKLTMSALRSLLAQTDNTLTIEDFLTFSHSILNGYYELSMTDNYNLQIPWDDLHGAVIKYFNSGDGVYIFTGDIDAYIGLHRHPYQLVATSGDKTTYTYSHYYTWLQYDMHDRPNKNFTPDYKHTLSTTEREPVHLTTPTVQMEFSIMPEKITVRCWDSSCWDNPDAKAEDITVQGNSFQAKRGLYIYEVTAQWDTEVSYGIREATYCLYLDYAQ